MTELSQEAPRTSPAHAICVYAEPLADGRRVIVVGDASLDFGGRLADSGARMVHVYDPNAERARKHAHSSGSGRGVTVRALPQGDLDVRDGAFDLAIVPDLSAVEDPAALLSRLRKVVGGEGAVLVAARNPEAQPAQRGARPLEYAELYDLMALQFASVRMIAMVPFTGVTLAELGDSGGEPEVSVDTQLAPESALPDAFLALGSQRDARLGSYAIVQLPNAAPAALPSAQHEADDAAVRASLAAAQLRADLLSSQLEEQRAATQRLTSDTERARKTGEIEAAKLKDADTRAGDHYVRAERLTHDIKKLEDEVERQRGLATRLGKELEEERRVRTRIESDLGLARKNPDLATSRERVLALEEALRAAEESVALHQARLHDAERATSLRDQQLAVLASEFEAVRAAIDVPQVDPSAVQRLAERAERADGLIAALETDLANIGSVHTEELSALEAQLVERGRVIQAHEAEMARRERMVQDLVATLEETRVATDDSPEQGAPSAHAAPDDGRLAAAERDNAELREKLDRLALQVARREGDLQSQAWRIAELEQNHTEPAAKENGARELGERNAQLAAARGELDALRQALTQEHDARSRAESGAELSKARAELARQATLIEQLSRELEARDRVRAPERPQTVE